MHLECHPLIMQDSQKMYSPGNWKITTYCECLTKHGKNRHNCTEGKHVIDILRQWKAGYQMLDLTLWVSGLMFLWWPSADGTNPVGMDHAGVQDEKKEEFSVMQAIINNELWRYWSGIAHSQKGWITNTTINIYENHTNIFHCFSLNLICNEGISDHTWKSAK